LAGTVEELGEEVDSIKIGDAVVVYFYLTCGKCRFCLSDRETICENFRGNVGTRIDGGLAEFVKLPAENLFQFSEDEIDYAEASIISDAIATPLHIAKRRAQISRGEKMLVIGAGGGVGIHMVQMAKRFGAEVIAVDTNDDKLILAKKCGASHTINANTHDVPRKVMGITEKAGVDAAIDFVSSEESTKAAYESLAPAGRLVLLGHFHPNAKLEFDDPQATIRKELSVLGSRYAKGRVLGSD
jgi:propanol-preferring alcohol dehydrogenase